MTQQAQEYLRTKVMTASPAELRLLLLDGALRFAEQAREGLEAKNFEQAYEGSRQCRAILAELTSGLRPDVDRELCDRLSGLYTFLYTSLVDAMSERDPNGLRKVVELLAYERETWSLMLVKLADENVEAARVGSGPVSAANGMATPAPIDGDLIGGRVHFSG
ncbi:MAG: flagellar export chaperone FliS [Hyphomonas sp. TMED17]|nr:MAG: flagellar export chaperone FliS [Hyphomonas sp. TMED17]